MCHLFYWSEILNQWKIVFKQTSFGSDTCFRCKISPRIRMLHWYSFSTRIDKIITILIFVSSLVDCFLNLWSSHEWKSVCNAYKRDFPHILWIVSATWWIQKVSKIIFNVANEFKILTLQIMRYTRKTTFAWLLARGDVTSNLADSLWSRRVFPAGKNIHRHIHSASSTNTPMF